MKCIWYILCEAVKSVFDHTNSVCELAELKQGELLETLREKSYDNQQPSTTGDCSEGSTTREYRLQRRR